MTAPDPRSASRQTCVPIAPLKCWRYMKSSQDPVPTWALPWLLMQPSGVLEFVWPDNGGQQELPDGSWLVLLEPGDWSEPWCAWYTDDEFMAQYELREVRS